MELGHCDFYVVHMISQNEMIIIIWQRVQDHANGHLLFELHIEPNKVFHVPLHSVHVVAHRLSRFHLVSHEGFDHLIFLMTSSLVLLFQKFIVHLTRPMILNILYNSGTMVATMMQETFVASS